MSLWHLDTVTPRHRLQAPGPGPHVISKCETCTKVKEEGERKRWTSKYILNGAVRTFDIAFVWNNEIKYLLFLTSLQLHLNSTQLLWWIVISQFQCSTWFLLLLINRSVPLAMACLHQFPVFLESKLITPGHGSVTTPATQGARLAPRSSLTMNKINNWVTLHTALGQNLVKNENVQLRYWQARGQVPVQSPKFGLWAGTKISWSTVPTTPPPYPTP